MATLKSYSLFYPVSHYYMHKHTIALLPVSFLISLKILQHFSIIVLTGRQ